MSRTFSAERRGLTDQTKAAKEETKGAAKEVPDQ